jgi:hypothetical protein
MKLLYKYITLFFLTNLCFAQTPTEEGLFRNGINPDISSDLIIYKIHINSKRHILPEVDLEATETTDQKALSEVEKEKDTQSPVQESVEIIEENNYIKVIVFNNTSSTPQYLFLYYSSPDYNSKSLKKIIPIMHKRNIISSQYDESSQIMIGLLQMFTLNQSTPLVEYLKSVEPDFKTNKEALDAEKVALFKRYHDYLKLLKENPELKEDDTIENPRHPSDEEKLKAVQEIEKRPMYTPSKAVVLTREDNTFYWNLIHNNIQAQFDHGTLFLKQLKIKSVHNYIIDVENFVLYTNKHLLPPRFIINIENKEMITIKFDLYQSYPKSNAQITERIDYYSKRLDQIEKEKQEQKSNVMQINGENIEQPIKKPFINLLYRLK